MIERLDLPAIREIASEGAYGRSYVGGTVGRYDETPTISAVGYTDLLTSTWLNKHNVPGNDNLSPNYNYPTIFRLAKDQKREVKTALFSSWIDNRTVLIGEGRQETGNLTIDYVYDGYELDREKFPDREYDLRIFDIDEHVSECAAQCIREQAPDLSWVYLWYTDDAGHIFGNGEKFGISQNSEIVNYNENGYMSYTFHYKNSVSNIEPYYFVAFSCDTNVYDENMPIGESAKKYADFDFPYWEKAARLSTERLFIEGGIFIFGAFLFIVGVAIAVLRFSKKLKGGVRAPAVDIFTEEAT